MAIRINPHLRELTLTPKGKSPMDKKKTEKKQYGPERNSIEKMVQTGDKAFLKRMGWTHKEAKEKLKEWKKQVKFDSVAMERWYRYEVEGPNKLGGNA